MHPYQIELLELLEPEGTFGEADIRELLDRIFPKSNTDQGDTVAKEKAIKFLNKLKSDGYIDFNDADLIELDKKHNSLYILYYEIKLLTSITDKGDRALQKYRYRKSAELLTKSVIHTNESIVTTGESVQVTNSKMIENASEQAIINTKLADNSTEQTKSLSKQTFLLYITGFIALVSTIIAGFTLYESIHKDRLQKQLDSISTELYKSRMHISRLKTDSSRELKAKKTDTLKKKSS